MADRRTHSIRELEDAFVEVTFRDEPSAAESDPQGNDPFFQPWVDQGSAKFAYQPTYVARQLRRLYPNHAVVPLQDYSGSIMSFPGAIVQPVSPHELISTVIFVPLQRRTGQGALVDAVDFGSFHVAWNGLDFILYIIKYPQGFGLATYQFLLHEGSEENARALIRTAGSWAAELHQEILVFNQGFWQKDHSLWQEVQKANWDDVILKDEFKTNLQKDVIGFFDSEELYRKLAIPWKRGIIMYGPPGNGKTISIKAVMKDCDNRGYAPLYVKSFQSWKGEEGAMEDVFSKARQMAPCMLVLEDLDALITDRNRSFFLNQLDGLQGNDGLLVIGTTNHFEKLDPALSGRPSRFDRKYDFPDPERDERALYALYWQKKLADNKAIVFPDSLIDEVADGTDKFSFAYLKEAFVSALVTLAGYEGESKPSFRRVLLGQIRTLKKQIDRDPRHGVIAGSRSFGPLPAPPRAASNVVRREYITDSRLMEQARIWDTGASFTPKAPTMPGEMPPSGPAPGGQPMDDRRDVRSLTAAVSALGRSFIA